MRIATLDAVVNLDTTGLTSGISSVRTHMSNLSGEFGAIDGQVTQTGNLIQRALGTGLGQIIADGVKAGMGFLWDFAKESIEAASDMTEIRNVIDTIFDGSSLKIYKWAETTKEAFGISERDALKYASQMAPVFESIGFSADESAEMAMNLIERIGDIASFRNLSFDDVFTKIMSGLRGETESIEDLGVTVHVNTMVDWLGLDQESEFTKDMSQKEQWAARYQFILEKTASAEGDFYKTQNTYANQMRIMQSTLDELKTSLGEGLLPVVTQLLTVGNGLLGWFNGLFGESISASAGIDAVKESARDSYYSIETTTTKALALVNALNDLSESGENAANSETWNAVLSELESTIPGIGDLIDSQTGKINGGTQALKDYIGAWQLYALEQAKQAAMQGMYDEYAQMALDVVQLQNDQYIADTLEVGLYEDAEKIVEELAQAALAVQQEQKPGTVNDKTIETWRSFIREGLKNGGDVSGWRQDSQTWGALDSRLGYMTPAYVLAQAGYTAEAIEALKGLYRQYQAEAYNYANVDNSAAIAERQMALAQQGRELEVMSSMFDRAIDNAKEEVQINQETYDTIAGADKNKQEAESETPADMTSDAEASLQTANNAIEATGDAMEVSSENLANASENLSAAEFTGTIVVHVYLDGQEIGDTVTERVQANIARDAATGAKTN